MTEAKGHVYGNYYNKYETANPIARVMVRGFMDNITDLVAASGCNDAHQVGCGEGFLSALLSQRLPELTIRASDWSEEIIGEARTLHAASGVDYSVRDLYHLDPEADGADLILCCEVMEHLEEPEAVLRALQSVCRKRLVLSVPREPLWRILNIARGKYIGDLGNTPGHFQHWSKREFLDMVARYFEVLEVRSPIPWTMVLCKPYAASAR